ncbi:MAG: hypothetical protein QOE41_3548 [Mycobacterium sp.]|jgi:thioredoxin reductase|nr:hypothetical protein [Mycobacterium sp.]
MATLRVAIVGGGIGGLSAAVALRDCQSELSVGAGLRRGARGPRRLVSQREASSPNGEFGSAAMPSARSVLV